MIDHSVANLYFLALVIVQGMFLTRAFAAEC